MKTTRLLPMVLLFSMSVLLDSTDLLAQCTGADEYGYLMFFADGSGDGNYQVNQARNVGTLNIGGSFTTVASFVVGK